MNTVVARITVLFISLLLTTGCMRMEIVMNVNKDGSGTLDLNLLVKKDFMELAKSFANDGTENTDEEEQKDFFTEEDMKKFEKDFGKVSLVSYEKIENDDYAGSHAVYSFDNVSEVITGNDTGESSSNDMSFILVEDGKTRKLLINMGQRDRKDNVRAEKEEAVDGNTKAMIDMMKSYFEDLYVSFKVKVDGKIKSTNATRLDSTSIVLMDLDFNGLIKDDKLFKAFYNDMSKNSSNMFQDYGVNGMYYEPKENIEIVFE